VDSIVSDAEDDARSRVESVEGIGLLFDIMEVWDLVRL